MLVGCLKSERSNSWSFGFRTLKTVWNPNKIVRISDIFSTEQIVQPNRSDLSEIRTVQISDVDCTVNVRNPNSSDFG